MFLFVFLFHKFSFVCSMMMKFVVTAIFYASLALNVPKLFVLYQSMTIANNPFRIFYWQPKTESVISASSPLWLMVHLLSAQMLFTLSAFKILGQQQNVALFSVLHYWNCYLIFINCVHFSNFPTWKAMLVNLIAIILLQLAHHFYWDVTYFVIFSTPIFIELSKKLMVFLRHDDENTIQWYRMTQIVLSVLGAAIIFYTVY